MKVIDELLGGVKVIEFARFDDERGSFAVPFQTTAATEAGLPASFVQDSHSTSARAGTIRGLHLQLPPFEQGKLIRVLKGRVLDVFVDIRPRRPSRGYVDSFELSADRDLAIWVPPGFAHGVCTLEPDTEVFYKVDAPYTPSAEISLAWDDPRLGIEWPLANPEPVMSDKDRMGLSLPQVFEAYDAASQSLP